MVVSAVVVILGAFFMGWMPATLKEDLVVLVLDWHEANWTNIVVYCFQLCKSIFPLINFNWFMHFP